ncbi:lachesin-like isoform X2 [Eupeodes corollae]|uniref:lachesin-like isoform X2 n=1 Tax=Eupeodes corollae TaxID=290404 RepID=UPI0024931062|nr:lachesin-like isoform X2 [Eupeodes corollae]
MFIFNKLANMVNAFKNYTNIHIQSWLLIVFIVLCHNSNNYSQMETAAEVVADPKFSYPISNVTASVGREALLTCVVQDLGSYKVAWLRVDTQTILTIQNHVITKNQRIGITYSEHKTWQLKIKDIKETDKGWYMCQINTDPMKSQMGYLDVVVSSIEGLNLVLPHVKRQHMGAYLCIASNGVPPSVSKRITLIVHFPPMITVQNQLIGAVEGKGVTLECQSEAFPKSINYWTRERGEIVPPGGKFQSNSTEMGDYKVSMKLQIYPLTQSEFGSYRCVAKNSLGDTDGTIKLYRIPPNAVNYLDNFEGRHKGKKRIKSSELYHQAKSVDAGDDPENPVKRKDVILGDNDDAVHDASSALSIHSRIFYQFSKQLIWILMSTASFITL